MFAKYRKSKTSWYRLFISTNRLAKFLFASYNSDKIKLACEPKYNYKRKNQLIVLMINDEAKKCYYFNVKELLSQCLKE